MRRFLMILLLLRPLAAKLTMVLILGILAFSAAAQPTGQAPERTNVVPGVLSATNFQARIHALEQRNGVETLADKASSTNLEMRVFKIDPNVFLAAVRDYTDMKVSDATKTPDPLKFFSAIGMDLTAAGRAVAFNDRLGMLFVKATPSELDTIERVIQVLNETASQIHIKARFVEVLIPEGGFHSGPFFNVSNTVAGQMTGILSDPLLRVMLRAFEQRYGFELLAEPEVTTLSGRQVQMRATEIFNVITNYALEDYSHKPAIVP